MGEPDAKMLKEQPYLSVIHKSGNCTNELM